MKWMRGLYSVRSSDSGIGLEVSSGLSERTWGPIRPGFRLQCTSAPVQNSWDRAEAGFNQPLIDAELIKTYGMMVSQQVRSFREFCLVIHPMSCYAVESGAVPVSLSFWWTVQLEVALQVALQVDFPLKTFGNIRRLL